MGTNEPTTEEVILKAAEDEFMERGYDGAKMLSIARRAGVAHSMLHYYYRSKQNLFQTIFARKIEGMLPAYDALFGRDLTFEQTLRGLREARDRYFLLQNPHFPLFILTEMLAKPKNRSLLLKTLHTAGNVLLERVRQKFEAEVEAGRVRRMSFADFMLLVVSHDASVLAAVAICRGTGRFDAAAIGRLQEGYREHNMQLIMDALRP